LYLPRYDSLCDILPWYWQPYSGTRSPDDQDRIYAIGRTVAPDSPIRTKAKAWESPHNYGCASDWTIFDDRGHVEWPDLDSEVWREYQNACEKVGVRWGGAWGDGPHNELPLDIAWRRLCARLRRNEKLQDEEAVRAMLEKYLA